MTEQLVVFQPTTIVDVIGLTLTVISGPETLEMAIAAREDVKALLAEIDAGYRPHIQRAHEAHKALVAELKTRSELATQALHALNTEIGRYTTAQRAREERERQENERKAREAIAQGEPIETAIAKLTPVAMTTTAGVAVSETVSVELVDLALLVQFAHEHPHMMALCLQPNEAGLTTLAKQMGKSFNVPGVKRVTGTSVRSTRGRR